MNGIHFCFLIVFIFEGLVFSTYCASLFRCKYSQLFLHFASILLYTGSAFVFFLGQPEFNTICIGIGNFCIAFLLCSTKWFTAVFHTIISILMMGLTEIIVIALMPVTFSYSMQSWEDFRTWIVPLVCCKLLYFFAMLILRNLFSLHKTARTEFNKSALLLLIPPVICFYFMFTFHAISGNQKFSATLDRMISISAILLLVLNICVSVIYSYMSEQKEEYADMKLSLQHASDMLENYKMQMEQQESQYRLIHDIKKHLQSIAILNQKQENEKITDYVNNLMQSSALQPSVHLCSNELLNAILFQYRLKCRNCNIDFHADIRNASCDFLTDTDLTSLFCNLLDNAIESAEKCEYAFLEITCFQKKNTPVLVIAVVNSCETAPFSTNDGQLLTSKSEKKRHGHGLKIIRKIVKRHNGDIQYYYAKEDYEFHTIITLRNPI